MTSSPSITIRPHAGQLATINATQPYVAAIAGTGGGKTVSGEAWVLKQLALHPGEPGLIAEPTWPMVDRILMTNSPGRPSLLTLLRRLDQNAIYIKADRTIHTIYGTIFLASATHPESMEGAHVRWAWLDEAGMMSYLAFETACRRTSLKSGQVLVTTTPYNRGWLYRNIYQKWQHSDPDYHVTRYSSMANPNYPKDVFERNRASMTPQRFAMMHEGNFERPEAMIHSNWDDKHLIDPFPLPHEWWQGAGIDFGFNHPTAAVWAARDDDGVYYMHQEYRKSQALLAGHHATLTTMSGNGSNPQIWYADPAAKQSIAELRRLGMPMVPANNDVANGNDTVGTLIATGRLKVFKGLTHWIDEVESYSYELKDGQATDKPIKLNDDLMDATRYLLHTAEKQRGLFLHT